jgi:hypothetical protein
MTDRAELVEKVAKSLWSLQYLTPYETDANSSAKIEFRAISDGLISLIRNETLEEAARVADDYAQENANQRQDEFGPADWVAEELAAKIRALKDKA